MVRQNAAAVLSTEQTLRDCGALQIAETLLDLRQVSPGQLEPEEDRTGVVSGDDRFPIEAAVLLPQRRVVALVVADEPLHIAPFVDNDKRELQLAETPLTLAVLAPNGVVMVGMAISTMVGREWRAVAFVPINE